MLVIISPSRRGRIKCRTPLKEVKEGYEDVKGGRREGRDTREESEGE
jgi:hypothetical protein